MPTIDEYASSEDVSAKSESVEAPQQEPIAVPRVQVPEFLKAKTGSGNVEDYIDHPMNIGKNAHFARMLRGLTGMFNALDYAIIDVVVGALGFMKKKPPIDVPRI